MVKEQELGCHFITTSEDNFILSSLTFDLLVPFYISFFFFLSSPQRKLDDGERLIWKSQTWPYLGELRCASFQICSDNLTQLLPGSEVQLQRRQFGFALLVLVPKCMMGVEAYSPQLLLDSSLSRSPCSSSKSFAWRLHIYLL